MREFLARIVYLALGVMSVYTGGYRLCPVLVPEGLRGRLSVVDEGTGMISEPPFLLPSLPPSAPQGGNIVS